MEETGRYSVSPSTTPRMAESRMVICFSAGAVEVAGAVVA